MYRFYCGQPVELRADRRTLSGYAAVFYRADDPETEYRPWEGHAERIAPGAFSRAITEGDDVRALFNHQPDYVLGRTKSGTLKLSEDEIGLRYEIMLPDTQSGRDVREMVSRGDVTGSSFAFRVSDKEDFKDGDDVIREVRSVELYDVGPVTYPAYTATSVEARCIGELQLEFADRFIVDWAAREKRLEDIAKQLRIV